MKTFKNINDLNLYIEKNLDFWINKDETRGKSVRVLNECWDNSIEFYYNFKHNFTNKIWIKYGVVFVDDSPLPLVHCWNIVKIGNKKHLIDLSVMYIKKFGLNSSYKYIENVDGYIFEHNYTEDDMKLIAENKLKPDLPPPVKIDINKQKNIIEKLKEKYKNKMGH